jgi:hypothetical protein
MDRRSEDSGWVSRFVVTLSGKLWHPQAEEAK